MKRSKDKDNLKGGDIKNKDDAYNSALGSFSKVRIDRGLLVSLRISLVGSGQLYKVL